MRFCAGREVRSPLCIASAYGISMSESRRTLSGHYAGKGVAAASSSARMLPCEQGALPLRGCAAGIIRCCADRVPRRAMLAVAASLGMWAGPILTCCVERGQGSHLGVRNREGQGSMCEP